MAHVIVMGNEKGGSGKSTSAMHVITALARAGNAVGAMDLDLRQQSLFRYLDNRADYMRRHAIELPMPRRAQPRPSEIDSRLGAEAEDQIRFDAAIAELAQTCDYILIDCPGSHTGFARMAHAIADTLITPMNDTRRFRPARRASTPRPVASRARRSIPRWSGRRARPAPPGRRQMDWVVLRNRMAALDARNKRRVGVALTELATRIGFRLVPVSPSA